MAGSVNKVILVGNLGADPESNTTGSGSLVVNLSVATSESWRDNNSGDRKERTEWHRVVLFGNKDSDGLAGVAKEYAKKGSKVYVEGMLQTRKWQDQSGQDKYTTEVVVKPFGGAFHLLDKSEGGGNRPPPPNGEGDYGRESSSSARPGSGRPGQRGNEERDRTRAAFESSGSDDDIPF